MDLTKLLKQIVGDKPMWAGSFCFTAFYLFIVCWFRYADVWNNHFAQTGYIYIFYNLNRVIFLLYFAWILYFSGKLILSFLTEKIKKVRLDSLDVFLLSSYLGATLFIFIIFFLCVSKLLYTFNALVITTSIVFISYRNLKDILSNATDSFQSFIHELVNKQSRGNLITALALFVMILCQTLYFLVTKGLCPDLIGNDTIGHYMPYFNYVIKNHGIWMNKYYFHHFYSKGAGLHFLSVMLTDIQSLQLVSFYFFSLSSLVLYSAMKKLCNNESLWPLLAIVLYFSSSIFLATSGSSVAEFQKSHITTGAFIIFIVYMAMLAYSFPPDTWLLWSLIQMFVIISTVILSPVSFVFIFPFILFQISMFYVLRKKLLFKYSVVSCGIISSVFAFMLIFNYLSSGLFEITPRFFYKYRNESVMRKWVSPTAIFFQFQKDSLESPDRIFSFELIKRNIKYALFDKSMIPFRVYLPILAASAAILIFFTEGALKGEIPSLIFPICFMIFLIFFIHVIVKQSSLYRYTTFIAFFRVALYIYSLYLLTSFSKGREIPVLLIILAVSVISLANFYRLYNNSSNINYYSRFSGKMINIADKINFISGKTNYAELYQKRWGHISLGLNIQKLIGHNNKVMVMNFLPGLYGIPGSKFQRSLMNDYNRDVDFRTVMFGDTEESITTLKKYNINYFLIDLNRPLLLLPIAFSPLFEPKNLKRNFKIVASFDSNILLLTWKKKQGAEIDNDFILTYSQHYENRKNNFFFRVYHAVKEILERCCSNFKLDSTKGCIPKNL